MKYLAIVAALLIIATNVFAELTDTEKRQALAAAREKLESARVEFDEARRELNVDISIELELARDAMDAAAEALAEIHVQSLGEHRILEFQSGHGTRFDARPQLGLIIGVDDQRGGVKLIAVTPGSGAQEAGLAAGDRVVEISGISLKGLKGEQAVDRLVAELEDLEDGDLVNLVYESNGKMLKTKVMASRSKSNMWSFLGGLGNIDVDIDFDLEFLDEIGAGPLRESVLELSDIDAVMGHYFGVQKGVLVMADKRDENGFLPGDIIKSINGHEIESTREALKQLAEDNDKLHKVKVLRKGKNRNLDVASLEELQFISHSNFFWTSDKNAGVNKKVIVRKIGGHSTGQKDTVKSKQGT